INVYWYCVSLSTCFHAKTHPVKQSLSFLLGFITLLPSITLDPLQSLGNPFFILSLITPTSFISSSTSFFHSSTLFPSFISTFSDNRLGYRCERFPSFLYLLCIPSAPYLFIFIIESRVYRYTSTNLPHIPYAFCIHIHAL